VNEDCVYEHSGPRVFQDKVTGELVISERVDDEKYKWQNIPLELHKNIEYQLKKYEEQLFINTVARLRKRGINDGQLIYVSDLIKIARDEPVVRQWLYERCGVTIGTRGGSTIVTSERSHGWSSC